MSAEVSHCATLDTVVERVASNPGLSVGLTADQLRTAWTALSLHIEDSLLKKKSVIVPNFCHFLLQEQVNHMGTWDTRSAWIPAVLPLQAFSSAYQLRNPAVITQMHVGAKVPTFLNGCAVAELAQMPRNAVIHAIADIVRQIGTIASSGKSLQVDMSFCLLDFSQRRMGVKWSTAFLERFAEALGTSLSHATRKVERPSTARSTITTGGDPLISSPRLNQKVQLNSADAAAAANAAPQTVAAPTPAPAAPATERLIPAPPKATVAVTSTASAAPAPPSAARPSTARRPLPQEAGSGGARSGSATPRRDGAATPATPPLSVSPRREMQVSPRLTKQDIDDIVNGLPKEPNTFHRRRARKTLYRRMRNHAYEVSWEAQIAMKAREAEEERQRDREKVEAFKRYLVEQQEKEAAERAARLAEGKSIQQLNKELAESRDKLRLPAKCPPGDIFDARAPTYTAAHDVNALLGQIEQRRERLERDVTEDRKHGQLAADLARQAKEEAQLQREEKRRAQQEMAKVYEAETQRRLHDRQHYKSTLTNGGALLFSGTDDASAEAVEAQAVKQRTRAFQEENKRLMHQRGLERHRQAAEEKARNDALRQQFIASDKALRAQKHREQEARKADLRSTWTSQMSARRAREAAEKDSLRTWKEMNYLRNESSDDES